MSSTLSAWRIASTAAWSAAFSSPRPIQARARERRRLGHPHHLEREIAIHPVDVLAIAQFLPRSRLASAARPALQRLDADHPRRLEHRLQRRRSRAARRSIAPRGLVRGQHDRHRLAGCAPRWIIASIETSSSRSAAATSAMTPGRSTTIRRK